MTKFTAEYTKSKICELKILFANIRTSFRTNLEYAEGHIYFQTDHKVLPRYKTWNPQSNIINIRPARYTYTDPSSTETYSSTDWDEPIPNSFLKQ